MSDFRQAASERDPSSAEILAAVKARLALIAGGYEITSWDLTKYHLIVRYSLDRRSAKLTISRPTTSRKVAQAILHHAQHFLGAKAPSRDTSSPDPTPEKKSGSSVRETAPVDGASLRESQRDAVQGIPGEHDSSDVTPETSGRSGKTPIERASGQSHRAR